MGLVTCCMHKGGKGALVVGRVREPWTLLLTPPWGYPYIWNNISPEVAHADAHASPRPHPNAHAHFHTHTYPFPCPCPYPACAKPLLFWEHPLNLLCKRGSAYKRSIKDPSTLQVPIGTGTKQQRLCNDSDCKATSSKV